MITNIEKSKFHPVFISAIDEIDRLQWNSITGTGYPFLRHEFLAALEHSDSVSAATGWHPRHLLLYHENTLFGVMPLYLKFHSYGEYVFDWAWADAYHRHNLSYYPKLLSAIPFTPATGPRLCLKDERLRHVASAAVFDAIQDQLQQQNSSSWHLLFPPEQEREAFCQLGLAQRTGCQYHWFNRDYLSFDQFLGHLNSRKRKNINRERRRVTEQGLHLSRFTGNQITNAQLLRFYHFYQATYLKRAQRGYLTLAFFQNLLETIPEQLLLVLAYHDRATVAGAFFVQGDDTLYGRYWGCLEEYEYLHFEACYYQGISHCIEQGIDRFDPGAQGEHKIARGFEPITTYSIHWVVDPGFRTAIDDFLRREQIAMEAYRRQAAERLPFKKQPS